MDIMHCSIGQEIAEEEAEPLDLLGENAIAEKS